MGWRLGALAVGCPLGLYACLQMPKEAQSEMLRDSGLESRKSQPKEKWIVHRFTAQQEAQNVRDRHFTTR